MATVLLPIKKTITDFDVRIGKNQTYGKIKKGEYKVEMTELGGSKKYYEVYLQLTGETLGDPWEWRKDGTSSKLSDEKIILLAKQLFLTEISKDKDK